MSTENPSIAEAQTEIHTIANDTDLLAPHNPAIHSPNKNRNNRHPRNKPSANGNHQQTMLSRTPKPNNLWKQSNKAPKFENIMNEQQKQRSKNRKSNNHTQYNYNYNEDPFGMLDEETLLEQQLLFQAIAESNQSSQLTQSNTTKPHNSSSVSSSSPHSINNANHQLASDKDDEKHAITIEPTSTNTSTHTMTTTKTSNVDDDEIAAAAAVDESIVESTHKVNPMQGISDEMLAIHLQREEQHQLQRQQKLKERFNGKYAKVTSSSSELAPIPKSALKFYYDDECILNGDAGLTKNELQGQTLELNDRESSPSKRERLKKQSKHDIKRWSDTHMHRLNEYENAGNLDMNRSIGNKAYNAFRNQLDQKGYISYHNYALEPKDK